MTSDHNSSELGIHDHNNEPSSSKLVPKVVPPADKTATSQQELELLFSPMYEEYFNLGNRRNDSFAFVHELKQEMHADLKYVESLVDEIDELESDKAEFSNMYDMLLQECVSNDIMCSYLQSSSNLDEITAL
ncbi:hypothetical protein Tco_0407418 [Tanacetum coccineum]